MAQAGWTALGVRRGVRLGQVAGGPMLATLLMTYRCNNACFMCRTREVSREFHERGVEELDTEGLKQLIDGFSELGIPALSLTGGEPLLRSDLPELVIHARSKGLLVHLNTNGTLVDEMMAHRLLEAGVDSVNLSLDGATPETHNRLRHSANGFAQVKSAVHNLRKARGKSSGPFVNIVSVVSSENLEEIPAIVALAREWNADSIGFIPAQFFEIPSMRPQGDRGMTPQRLDDLDRILNALRDDPIVESSSAYLDLFRHCLAGNPSPLTCLVGFHAITVDCHANIYPCFPFGLMGGRSPSAPGENLA